jgi:hypothetical protein
MSHLTSRSSASFPGELRDLTTIIGKTRESAVKHHNVVTGGVIVPPMPSDSNSA